MLCGSSGQSKQSQWRKDMSYVDDRHNIGLCPNRGLSVVTCGWMQCHGGHTCPERFYPDHSLTFVLKGKGYYTIDGKTFPIQAGQCFAIFPDTPISYIADEKNPWEYIFAIITGEDVLHLIETLGLTRSAPAISFKITLSIIDSLNRMVKAGAFSDRLGYDVLGFFFLAVSEVAEQASRNTVYENPQHLYVEKSIAYMKTNYPYDVSVSGIAAYVGIEQSYLYRLFKKEQGVSLREWLVMYRLKKAVEMMSDDNKSITSIAHSVGFYDLSHFTKAFKVCFGSTPKDYRFQMRNAAGTESREIEK